MKAPMKFKLLPLSYKIWEPLFIQSSWDSFRESFIYKSGATPSTRRQTDKDNFSTVSQLFLCFVFLCNLGFSSLWDDV